MDFQIFIDMERIFSDIMENMSPATRPDIKRLVNNLRELICHKADVFLLDLRCYQRNLDVFASYLENLGRGVPGNRAVYAETCRVVQQRKLQAECVRLARRIRDELLSE